MSTRPPPNSRQRITGPAGFPTRAELERQAADQDADAATSDNLTEALNVTDLLVSRAVARIGALLSRIEALEADNTALEQRVADLEIDVEAR